MNSHSSILAELRSRVDRCPWTLVRGAAHQKVNSLGAWPTPAPLSSDRVYSMTLFERAPRDTRLRHIGQSWQLHSGQWTMTSPTPRKRRRPNSSELTRCFQSACRREEGALQQLLALYRPLLLKLAHKRIRGALRTKVGPSDLVQTTVWKATQGFESERFVDRSGFLAWLVTILKNEAADIRRRYRDAKKRDVSRERPLYSPETQTWLSQLSASLSATDAILSARHETVEQVLAALVRLPSHYQLVLQLRYYEKLDFGAIGKHLDRSYDAVRVLHNRALKRLREEILLLADHNTEPSTDNSSGSKQ